MGFPLISGFLGLALVAVPAAQALAQDDPLDPTDQSHVSVESATGKLERSGYSEVVSVDHNSFDAFIRLQATNPQGKRVELVLDNTTGSIVIERPVGG